MIETIFLGICGTEEKRHKTDHNPNLVFINNRNMDQYCAGNRNPRLLLKTISESHGVCREAFVQLLARKHAGFIQKNPKEVFLVLEGSDILHLVYGIRTAPDLKDCAKLLFILYEKDLEWDILFQVIRLFNNIDQDKHCESIMERIRNEKNPQVLTQWVNVLKTKACPDFLPWMQSLFEMDDFTLQQNILVKISTTEIKNRDQMIQAYFQHSNSQICSAARSIWSQLNGKNKLSLTPVISSMGQIKQDYNQTSNNQLKGALETNDFEGAKRAILNRANPNLEIQPYTTVLQLLASDKRPKLIWEKLSKKEKTSPGSNLNAFKVHEKRIIELVDFLIRNGADPNVQDKFGRTPLFHGVMGNRIELVKILLNLGADPELRTVDGIAPANLAEILERDKMMDLFNDYGSESE